MTAQIAEDVVVDGRTYSLVGVSGGTLFDPAEYDLAAHFMSSACWRGYVATFAIVDKQLVLSDLLVGDGSTIGGVEIDEQTSLLGVRPTRDTSWKGPGFLFSGLNAPRQLSGGLLVGDGFIQTHYVHMGFHPAWKFERVLELLVDGGHVAEVRDVSAELAERRRAIEAGEVSDPDGDRGGTSWVERAFTLDYSRSVER